MAENHVENPDPLGFWQGMAYWLLGISLALLTYLLFFYQPTVPAGGETVFNIGMLATQICGTLIGCAGALASIIILVSVRMERSLRRQPKIKDTWPFHEK